MDNKILFSKYRKKADIKTLKTYRVSTVAEIERAVLRAPRKKIVIPVKKLLKYTGFGLMLAALIYALYLGYDKINTSPDFEVREVKVAGNKYVSKNEILAIAKVEVRKNMFAVSLGEIKSKLKANPQFKGVSIKRVFPGIVEINVREREPVAYIGENKAYQVDAEGVTFPAIKSFFHGKRLYTFTGVSVGLNELGKKTGSPALKQGLAMVAKLEERGAPYLNDVMQIDIPCLEELALLIPNSKRVYKFGDGNWDEKIDKLICLLKNLNERKNEIIYVDLRFRDEAIVQFGNNTKN